MTYQVAEKFKAVQGEGMYAGTPMAFIRFVGCSVGKAICQHCDTDFDKGYPWKGGGAFNGEQLAEWVGDYEHLCLTGGEPLNQNLAPLFQHLERKTIHIETSGTVKLWLSMFHIEGSGDRPRFCKSHICVSPKPGWREDVIQHADEIKVIVGGLGEVTDALRKMYDDQTLRWPTLEDALRWAKQYPYKPVYLQPRNKKFEPDKLALAHAIELVKQHPQLRLSVQLHKFIGER